MSGATSAAVAEAVARHNVRNRKMTGVLTVSALLDELDRLRKVEEAARGTEKAHEVAEAMLGRLADKLTSLRRNLATAMGHDEVPDDDGLVKDVAWYVQMFRARDDTVPAGSVECDQCGGSGVTGPSGDAAQALGVTS